MLAGFFAYTNVNHAFKGAFPDSAGASTGNDQAVLHSLRFYSFL